MKFRTKQKGQILVVTILLKLILILFFLLFSELSNAASCYTYGYSTTNAQTGRVYQVYYDDNLNVDNCNEEVVLTAIEYARYKLLDEQNGDIEPITATNVMAAFTFGFSAYAMFWFVGFKGRLARQAIRSV